MQEDGGKGEVLKELQAIAQRAQEYQKLRGITESKLIALFPGLGSDRTFKKLLRGDGSQLDLERQQANYRAVGVLIDALGCDEHRREEYYPDLAGPVLAKRALLEAFKQDGNTRFVLIEGDTGTGKSAILRLLCEQFGQRIVAVEAKEIWGDAPGHMLGEILRKLGADDIPSSPTARYDRARDMLQGTRACIAIDEGHHLGKRTLNTLKNLINETPCEVLVLAMPTLWRRLETRAFEEARQLTGNRLAERVRLQVVTLEGALKIREKDVAKLVERRLPKPGFNGDLKQAVALLMAHEGRYGHLAFVRDVLSRLAENAEDGEAITIEQFAAAVTAEKESR